LQTLEIGETQHQTQTAKQPKARSLLAKVRTPLTYEEVVERLEELGYEPYESGYGVRSRCPVHQGEGHSLSVNPKDDDDSGGVLIHCFARNCTFGSILAALNLDGDDRPNVPITPRQVPPPKTYPTLDAALSAIGEGEGAKVWKYRRDDGTVCGAQVRIDRPDGRKEFRPVHLTAEGSWVIRAHPDPRPLYRLPELVGEASSVVFVAEGEKCVDRLAAMGKVATTSQGGALSPSKSDWSPLAGRDVVILPDNDQPGEGYAEAVCGILAGLSPPARVRIVRLPGLEPGGDVADWRVHESPKARRAALDALVDRSELVKPEPVARALMRGEDAPIRRIVVTPDEWAVNNQGIEALARDPDLFQRGGSIVTVVSDPLTVRGVSSPAGAYRIVVVTPPLMRERLARNAVYVKRRRGEDGSIVEVPAHPPEWSVAAVHARGYWEGLRPLGAILDAPTILGDGTLVERAGYDEASALLLIPSVEFPKVPDAPTQDDARRAAEELTGLLCDFPFVDPSHKVAWICGLLTVVGRFAIAGPCPLFAFEASTPGSGKSLLVDLISTIALGHDAARTVWPGNDEEFRKRVTAVALEGHRLCLIDDIDPAGSFGGSTLNAMLTATTWSDRKLGKSEMTSPIPLITTWCASGNNLPYRGDLIRRVVPCRLEPVAERPEERVGFRYPDIRSHALANRPALIVAALTILRAFFVAGRPEPEGESARTPLGGFEGWDRIARRACIFATGIDPCGARTALDAADSDKADRAALVTGWAELPGADKGLTTAEAIKLLQSNPGAYGTLRDALTGRTRNGEFPSSKSVGRLLAGVRTRTIEGWRVESATRGNRQVWRAVPTP
jgi:hypothetical protein